jgi:hypothetical protein
VEEVPAELRRPHLRHPQGHEEEMTVFLYYVI